MSKRVGILCIFLGVACLLGALGFVCYNRWEAGKAADQTRSILEEVQAVMATEAPEQTESQGECLPVPEFSEALPDRMPTISVDGYDCIGILSIPVLELELPVLTDWSYQKLKKAPCLYYGSYYEKDFVIAAHNYASYFGKLPQLQPGDLVIFTDVLGVDRYYTVTLMETLPKEATQEMITSGFDLSLYTCTPGGASRVTARCTAGLP